MLKAGGARRIQFTRLVSCPVGMDQLHRAHPDVPVITAAIDPELNEFGLHRSRFG
jgi:uracil phosphoribosyltransferase